MSASAKRLVLARQSFEQKELREECVAGRSIVMVSHDPNHAAQFASHGFLLFGDGLWLAGVLADVPSTETLIKLYHDAVSEIQQDGKSGLVPLA